MHYEQYTVFGCLQQYIVGASAPLSTAAILFLYRTSVEQDCDTLRCADVAANAHCFEQQALNSRISCTLVQ
jgi:hypothetical protein